MASRIRVIAVIATALLLMSVAPPAMAAAPAAPTLVGPADGSTAAVDAPLSVRASDPDGGSLDVRFVGRKVGATVPGGGQGSPFTVVALPDTQNYTYGGRQGTILQQTQWAVNTRAQLNTAMVVQLGDLVSDFDNLTQWGHASNGFEVLDDANLPNTVVRRQPRLRQRDRCVRRSTTASSPRPGTPESRGRRARPATADTWGRTSSAPIRWTAATWTTSPCSPPVAATSSC